jgi:hypothetical protein
MGPHFVSVSRGERRQKGEGLQGEEETGE